MAAHDLIQMSSLQFENDQLNVLALFPSSISLYSIYFLFFYGIFWTKSEHKTLVSDISEATCPRNKRLTKNAEMIMLTAPKRNIITKSADLPRKLKTRILCLLVNATKTKKDILLAQSIGIWIRVARTQLKSWAN